MEQQLSMKGRMRTVGHFRSVDMSAWIVNAISGAGVK